MVKTLWFWVLAIVLVRAALAGEESAWRHGAVATAHPKATEVALGVMRSGGNAVDGAVAAGLTLGVVDGFNSGIGGGCFILLRTPTGEFVAIDGREMAPKAATRDMFLRDGKPIPGASETGAIAVGIPGSLMAYERALRLHGTKPLSELLELAARVAEEGFHVSANYASIVESVAPQLRRFPASKSIFLEGENAPTTAGRLFRQPDLARTYRSIARDGIKWFYEGPFAEATETWMLAAGGVVLRSDFADYKVVFREPLRTTFQGGKYEIVGFPPPSSGGVHVAQILNILDHLRPVGGFHKLNEPDWIHLVAESMKLAFADRAFWLGDPDFAPVPTGLVDRGYAGRLASRVTPERTLGVPAHSMPPDYLERLFKKHTTHFSTADASGYWVACTATVNTSFGSKVVVPGTGVVLNNQMDDFSVQPGAPNFFGLVGAEANAVAPGKRPLSSMSPTIVIQDGRPILSLGAAGGPTIISQTVVHLLRILEFGDDPGEAIRFPRFHHQWLPDELRIEEKGLAWEAALSAKGHKARRVSSMGVSQIIQHTDRGFVGASDPRVVGSAAGF